MSEGYTLRSLHTWSSY